MATQTCVKCGRTKKDTEFFKMKSGERCDMCKDCLTMHIDNRKPDTFMWILEKFDVPYIEKKWIEMTNKAYLKNPQAFGPKSVFGTYIRTMNMTQYREYTFADSDKLNFEDQKQEAMAAQARAEKGMNADYEAELRAKLDAGEISEAEYNTLSPVSSDMQFDSGTPQFIQDVSTVDEDKIKSELSEEDIQYLALKWGLLYKPSQWVAMETMYKQYEAEYDLSVDRTDVLKKICKISLKMDEALDVGDTKTFKDLSSTYDALRKSAKFTEAQNKEEQRRDIDSIGELVAFVEREGGIIPAFNDPIEYPQDKVDFTIKDMKAYTDRLVREELGLGDLIESFIEKTKQNQVQSAEDIMAGKEVDAEDEIDEEEAQISFSEFLDQEVMEESYALQEEFGD